MAWGGKRVGAGRKPKPKAEPARFAPPTTNDQSPIEEFDAPDSLTLEERQVWLKQAPHAFKSRTLTRSTALAFERYCRMVAREAIEAKSSAAEGPNHRGLRKEINTLELQFLLTASGRPLAEAPAEASVDEDDQFFGGPVGIVARGA